MEEVKLGNCVYNGYVLISLEDLAKRFQVTESEALEVLADYGGDIYTDIAKICELFEINPDDEFMPGHTYTHFIYHYLMSPRTYPKNLPYEDLRDDFNKPSGMKWYEHFKDVLEGKVQSIKSSVHIISDYSPLTIKVCEYEDYEPFDFPTDSRFSYGQLIEYLLHDEVEIHAIDRSRVFKDMVKKYDKPGYMSWYTYFFTLTEDIYDL